VWSRGRRRRRRARRGVEREVVNDERGLQRRVLGGRQENLDGLTLERRNVEGDLPVARGLVEIGVGRKRRENGVAGVAYLHLKTVEGGRRRGLRRVDVEPEGERR